MLRSGNFETALVIWDEVGSFGIGVRRTKSEPRGADEHTRVPVGHINGAAPSKRGCGILGERGLCRSEACKPYLGEK